MSPFKTKEFVSLHDEWMGKLKESGFEEIEDLSSQDERLRQWDSVYFIARHTEETFKNRQEYFERCRALAHIFQFSCWLERAVWEQHSEGLSLREIVRKLRTKENKLNKDKAAGFIRRIKKNAWGHE